MSAYKLWENGTPGFDPSFGQPEPNITPYPVETEKPRGCVIICPGGGYRQVCAHEGAPICEMINEGGFSAFLLEYRVAPYHHPAMQLDVNRAVRWVRYHAKEYNIDPDHIAVLGFSAGGHLAGISVTHFDYGLEDGDEIDRVSCRPDAGVLCYAVLDFLNGYGHKGTMNNLMGGLAGDDIFRRAYSIPDVVRDDTPPCYIWQTSQDAAVPAENALLMAKALHEHEIPFELHIFPYGGHGSALAKNDPHNHQWCALLHRWLALMGF